MDVARPVVLFLNIVLLALPALEAASVWGRYVDDTFSLVISTAILGISSLGICLMSSWFNSRYRMTDRCVEPAVLVGTINVVFARLPLATGIILAGAAVSGPTILFAWNMLLRGAGLEGRVMRFKLIGVEGPRAASQELLTAAQEMLTAAQEMLTAAARLLGALARLRLQLQTEPQSDRGATEGAVEASEEEDREEHVELSKLLKCLLRGKHRKILLNLWIAQNR
ncbi:hypothetical protein B0H11DRAFT_1937485 [Mycena galericulata]|nr:hypothetical protein B0H11DRAFT_1937485 [Mycena galericulata]